MYTAHFGLTHDPFAIAPDPRYLFMSARHREALAHLLFGVAGDGAGGGFVLLTGEIGTGKTTLCRALLQQIPQGCRVAYVFNPKLSALELLASVCQEFGVVVAPMLGERPGFKDYLDALNAFLLERHAAGERCVLIIDEAQSLSADVLEQLRLLTNLETNERKLLQIVLIGQPELRAQLAHPALEQLAQRVVARFHLDALTLDETMQYVTHRLAVAGLQGPLPFDAPALRELHRLARGVPRRINLLAGRALLGAYAQGAARASRATVRQASQEVLGDAPRSTVSGENVRLAWSIGLGVVALLVALAVLLARGLDGRVVGKSQGAASAASVAASPASPPDTNARLTAASRPASGAAPVVPGMEPTIASITDAEWPSVSGWSELSEGWGALARAWPLSEIPACDAAVSGAAQCLRTTSLSLNEIRQLARPGLLTMRQDDHAIWVVLREIRSHDAVLLTRAGSVRVPLTLLAQLWTGEWATFWRPPPGYQSNLSDGAQGPAVDALVRALDIVEGRRHADTAPTQLDSATRTRVRLLQRAYGLRADGHPGPVTFMLLDALQGRLQPEPDVR